MQALMRQAILSIARNPALRRVAVRRGMRLGVSRFVAGETLPTALLAVAELNRRGIWATLDHLGEYVSTAAEAAAATRACLEVLDGIRSQGLRCNLSVKLTQLGLDLDADLCRSHMRQLLTRAAEYGNFVRVDMEDSSRTDKTLALVRELIEEFGPERVGTVLQAYLYRTERDLRDLARRGGNVRLVKGAYMEPPDVAFPKKSEVDANFLRLIRRSMRSGLYTAVATHDEAIVAATRRFVADEEIGPDRFEFQMLYGIRRDLQARLVAEGYRVRVYVPFGQDWYGYFTRRLAERPANVAFVLRNLLRA